MEEKPYSKGDFILTENGEIMTILRVRKEDNVWLYYSRKWSKDGTPEEYWVHGYGIKAVARENSCSTLIHMREVIAL